MNRFAYPLNSEYTFSTMEHPRILFHMYSFYRNSPSPSGTVPSRRQISQMKYIHGSVNRKQSSASYIPLNASFLYVLCECVRRSQWNLHTRIAVIDSSKLQQPLQDAYGTTKHPFVRYAEEFMVQHIPPEAIIGSFDAEKVIRLSIRSYTPFDTFQEACIAGQQPNVGRGSISTRYTIEEFWYQLGPDEATGSKEKIYADLIYCVYILQVEVLEQISNKPNGLDLLSGIFRPPTWLYGE